LLGQRCGFLSEKRIASIRLASIYGEMERPTGSREHMSHVKRLWDARCSGKKVRVAGKKIERDWMYAGDMAEATWALLCAPRWQYPVYNIGSSQTISFEKMVEIFSDIGLNYSWVDEPGQADIVMRPEQGRAPMNTVRLKEDANYSSPLSSEIRLELFLHSII
jgi:nucleoside-diphosphate-sugar epimerase